MKSDLRGVRFRNLPDLEQGVWCALRAIPRQDFAAAVDSLATRWMKSVKANGKYFEGKHLAIDPEQDHGIMFETDSEFED